MQTVITAAAAFCATNLDDILLLSLLFACADTASRRHAVVWGQLCGIAILTALSLLAAGAVRLWLLPYVHFLGVLPILLGIRALLRLRGGEDDDAAPTALGMGGVLLLTVANGGDNLGVYIPLFAGQSPGKQLVSVFVFLSMTLLWCALAQLPSRFPRFRDGLHRFGRMAMPMVLILLGVLILISGMI